MQFQCKIDYQKVLTEDLSIIWIWFMFVWNVIIKYNILNSDIYNFDETGFLMGMLNYAKVVIISNYKNKLCMKQFGNYEWVSVIQIICVDGYVLLLYVIVKKNVIFFLVLKQWFI